MKNLLIIIASFTLFSCQIFEKDIVPNDFSKYLDTYIIEASNRGVDYNPNNLKIEIKFEKDLYVGATKAAGSAQRIGNKKLVIKIDTNWWNENDINNREVLMFHEFGHGFLDLRHNENIIMKTNKSKYETFKENRKEVIDDFFNHLTN
jgi:hypothetical protein